MSDENRVRLHRPYRAVRSTYAGSFDVRGSDGTLLAFHFHDEKVAEQFADALNGNGPGPDEPLTDAQARAFLASLWPEGELAYHSNHARTFLEALIGNVPRPGDLLGTYRGDAVPGLSRVLRQLADALDGANARLKKISDDMPF